MKKINFTFFAVMFLFIASCQPDGPKTDKSKPTTYASFYVRFLQSEKQANATASFTNGMTQEKAKSIKIKNGVFFHNGNMNERDLVNLGIRYKYDFDGEFSENFRFRFEDPLNGKKEHLVKINPIQNYTIEGMVSKKNGFILSWEGDPLNENESLVLMMSGENKKLASYEFKGKTDSNQIKIEGQKVASLEVGAGKIYLVRKKLEEIEDANLMIFSESEFYTQEKDFIINP